MLHPDLRILAFDDDRTMRRAIVQLAKSAGVKTVHEASSGQEALEIFRSRPVDFIISERDVPDTTGLDLLRAIQSHIGNALIPFLLTAKDSAHEGQIEAEDYGADGFLSKPYSSQNIEEKMDHILEDRAATLPMEILLSRAKALLDINQPESAREELRQLDELDRRPPRIRVGEGEVFQEIGQYERAEECFREALSLNRHFVRAYDRLSVLLLREGKTEDALNTIRIATQISPRNRDRLQFLGKVLLEKGDIEGARVAFFRSTSDELDAASRQASVGELFMASDRADLAETEFNDALAKNPGNVAIYNRRGISYRRQRKFTEAIKNYREAINIAPDDPVLYYNLALVLIEQDQRVNAVAALRRSLAIDPEFDKAKEAIAQIQTGEGPLGAPKQTRGQKPEPEPKAESIRRARRFKVPVAILAPTLSDAPVMVEDVSQSGILVLAARKPALNSTHPISLQLGTGLFGPFTVLVKRIEESHMQPPTYMLGLSLHMEKGEKDRFHALLWKAIGQKKESAGT
ncbi:MAG: tetratricopeptide repeat protein [bacterium]|nr:tetratricopeptide repeat protein [bacterium]